MNCKRCGKNLDDSLKCNFCGYENIEGNVREMTRTEKNFFNGVTINEDGTQEGQGTRDEGRGRNRIFVNVGGGGFFSRLIEKFIFALMNNNTLAKVAATLIFIAFAALMFFIALPILFFMIALGVALLIYAKFTRKF